MKTPSRAPAARAVCLFLASALVSVVHAASCNLSIGNLSFGAYVGSQISSTSNASLTCTNVNAALLPERVDYEVQLSPGAGTYAQRLMTRTVLPADTLPYNLYLNALPAVLNTSVWGDGSGTTVRWLGNFNLTPGQPSRTVTNVLVGAIPGGAFPAAGTYQDTIVATLIVR